MFECSVRSDKQLVGSMLASAAKREGIANANAELNNLGLPNVFAMAQALKYLAQQATLGPNGLPKTNRAVENALSIVAQYSDGSAGANL